MTVLIMLGVGFIGGLFLGWAIWSGNCPVCDSEEER